MADFYVFPEYLALWARSEPLALPGKFERNRGGEAMNRAKSRVLWARISPIQAISLFKGHRDLEHIVVFR
jgi:hypothetical protein